MTTTDRIATALDLAFADHEREHHGAIRPEPIPETCRADVAKRLSVALGLAELRMLVPKIARSDDPDDWDRLDAILGDGTDDDSMIEQMAAQMAENERARLRDDATRRERGIWTGRKEGSE